MSEEIQRIQWNISESPRCGDSDRDNTVSRLQKAHATGHLGEGLFETRMAAALQAETIADLKLLTSDLSGIGDILPQEEIRGRYYLSWEIDQKMSDIKRRRRYDINFMQCFFGVLIAYCAWMAGSATNWTVISVAKFAGPGTNLGFNEYSFCILMVLFVMNLIVAGLRWTQNYS